MANEFVELDRRKMEELLFQLQQEFEMLRRRLEEIEVVLSCSRVVSGSVEVEEITIARRLQEIYPEDAGMLKSIDLDRSINMDPGKRDVLGYKPEGNAFQMILGYPQMTNSAEVESPAVGLPHFTNEAILGTVFEEDEECNDERGFKNHPLRRCRRSLWKKQYV